MIPTKEEAIRLHRELWDWLYHHPLKGKEDWPKWVWNDGDLDAYNRCFLCDYVGSCCPVNWVTTTDCMSKRSYYHRWSKAKTPKTRKKYAKLIRDLPEASNAKRG